MTDQDSESVAQYEYSDPRPAMPPPDGQWAYSGPPVPAGAPLYLELPGLRLFGTAEQVGELLEALAKAQGNFQPIEKNRSVTIRGQKNGQKYEYSFRYADMDELHSATRPALTAEGVTVLQPVTRGDACAVYTMVCKGRALMVSEFKIDETRDKEGAFDLKAFAGDSTYGMRYGYAKALGLSTGEDADNAPQAGGESAENSVCLPRMEWLGEDAGRPVTEASTEGLERYTEWQRKKLDPKSPYYARNLEQVQGAEAELKKRAEKEPEPEEPEDEKKDKPKPRPKARRREAPKPDDQPPPPSDADAPADEAQDAPRASQQQMDRLKELRLRLEMSPSQAADFVQEVTGKDPRKPPPLTAADADKVIAAMREKVGSDG